VEDLYRKLNQHLEQYQARAFEFSEVVLMRGRSCDCRLGFLQDELKGASDQASCLRVDSSQSAVGLNWSIAGESRVRF